MWLTSCANISFHHLARWEEVSFSQFPTSRNVDEAVFVDVAVVVDCRFFGHFSHVLGRQGCGISHALAFTGHLTATAYKISQDGSRSTWIISQRSAVGEAPMVDLGGLPMEGSAQHM